MKGWSVVHVTSLFCQWGGSSVGTRDVIKQTSGGSYLCVDRWCVDVMGVLAGSDNKAY